MNAIDFYDFLALLLRYGGALIGLAAAVTMVVLAAAIVDHWHWTRRFDRTQVLDLITAGLWTTAAVICVLVTF